MIDVVAAVIKKNNKYLIAQRNRDKHFALYWEFPGGKVNNGESFDNALKREIMEEIGVKTQSLRKLTTYCPVPGYSDEIVHVYFAEVDKIKKSNLYNKFENEEIKIFKLSLNQLKKINDSKTIQNVLTKISIYEYLKNIKKN